MMEKLHGVHRVIRRETSAKVLGVVRYGCVELVQDLGTCGN